MITGKVRQSGATGVTAWYPVAWAVAPVAIELAAFVDSGATLTYKAQYTTDALLPLNCNITRSTTTATLKLPNHNLTTNDSIIVVGSGDTNLDGTYTVASVVDANTITYTVANTGSTQSAGTVGVIPLHVFDHGTITGKSADFDGSISVPVTAVRLNVTAWTSGGVTMLIKQGGR